MIDKNTNRQPMPLLDIEKRRSTFEEVSLGYDEESAVIEADRCLNCKNKPCVNACPVQIDIPLFLKFTRERAFHKAYDVIHASSSLPSVCGRVCPQESQCESKCVRQIKGKAVAIGRVERFIADNYSDKEVAVKEKKNIKMAVIGAGPAGLTCAGELQKEGFSVTIFEALHVAGGVLVYGIPEFRLPKKIVQKEIDTLIQMGVEVKTDMVMGKILSIDELFQMGYKSVFIGTGAGLPRFMNIKGENLNGVYSANEFLTRVNLMKAYKKDSATPVLIPKSAAIVGGGNVAMDAARCALRLGAEKVYIVYRRSEEEMPARREEIEHAKEEGILLKNLTSPCEILGDEQGNVKNIVLDKMELGEKDESGRRSFIKTGEKETLPVDCVIMAIGTSPNPLISATTEGLVTNNRGCIVTDEETGRTKRSFVYAGGDAVTGAATVILAMGAGKKAAQMMMKDVL